MSVSINNNNDHVTLKSEKDSAILNFAAPGAKQRKKATVEDAAQENEETDDTQRKRLC